MKTLNHIQCTCKQIVYDSVRLVWIYDFFELYYMNMSLGIVIETGVVNIVSLVFLYFRQEQLNNLVKN